VTAKVVVIGLDAADANLLEEWAALGECPAIASLIERGARVPLSTPLETLPGAIWPELASGVSVGRQGLYYHQLHPGESRTRPVTEDEVDSDLYYWAVASEAGRRVAVVDIPQTVPFSSLNGIQVFEWGLHDRSYAVASQPPELIDELRTRYGDHGISSCDKYHGQTTEGYLALRAALLDGARRKTDMLVDLLGREEWDLFTCAFGESHCVGHQFWGFMDESHPNHPSDSPPALSSAINDVYRALDRGIGEVIAAAGPDAHVLVVASHGMGPNADGPQLLPEVLIRLGMVTGRESLLKIRNAVPRPVRRAIGRLVPKRARQSVPLAIGERSRAMDSPAVRAMVLKNNRCGAIRVNLVGREPFGSVMPGQEFDALLDELRRALLELVDPESGLPIVTRVVTTDEAFGPDHHPALPDLLVVFRTDLGPLNACSSPRVGVVRSPAITPEHPRTGDHVPVSRLWSMGPGITAGETLPGGSVLDVAATVLDLLGVEPLAECDGRSLAPQLMRR
jgi:predicted AlkP superfamily phosphohydrolase/phosphomutase